MKRNCHHVFTISCWLLLLMLISPAAFAVQGSGQEQSESSAEPPADPPAEPPLELEPFAFDQHQPAAGQWYGELSIDGRSAPVVVHLAHNQLTGWSGTATALMLAVMDQELETIEVDDTNARFTLPLMGGSIQFDGTVSDDGQQMSGSATTRQAGDDDGDDDAERETGSFAFQRLPRPTDLAEPLAFSGALDVGPMELEMTIVLAKAPNGRWVAQLDVPMQNLHAYPFVDVTETDGRIRGTLPAPAPATIDVAISDDRSTLTGTFSQAGMDLEIEFERVEHYEYRGMERPQHPTPPFPYRSREITAPHPDGFSLAGTLTLPDPEEFGPGPYAAAILISGSGAQDRDETLLGHKPFLVIADYLTRRGIAVMRFDDRGVGGSRVDDPELLEQATTHDAASDVHAVLNRLREIDEIDTQHIGLIGHSEGGLIAPLLWQQDQDIAFMMLLAGPGVPGDELLHTQLLLQWKSLGASEESLEKLGEGAAELIARSRDGDDEQAIREAVEQLSQFEIEAGLSTEAAAGPAGEAAVQMMSSDWMRTFLRLDPQPLLAAVECPVFAANGTLDLQVWHEQNLDAIAEVMEAAGREATIRRYEGLNHLFQPAETGSVMEYAAIETTFSEDVLADIVQWIKSIVEQQDEPAGEEQRDAA